MCPELGCLAGAELLLCLPTAAAEGEPKGHELLWVVSHHKESPGGSALQGFNLWQDQDPNQGSVPHSCPYHSPTALVKKGDDEEGANQHHGLRDTSKVVPRQVQSPAPCSEHLSLRASPLKWRRCSMSAEKGPSSLGSQGAKRGRPCVASGLCYETPLSLESLKQGNPPGTLP